MTPRKPKRLHKKRGPKPKPEGQKLIRMTIFVDTETAALLRNKTEGTGFSTGQLIAGLIRREMFRA